MQPGAAPPVPPGLCWRVARHFQVGLWLAFVLVPLDVALSRPMLWIDGWRWYHFLGAGMLALRWPCWWPPSGSAPSRRVRAAAGEVEVCLPEHAASRPRVPVPPTLDYGDEVILKGKRNRYVFVLGSVERAH